MKTRTRYATGYVTCSAVRGSGHPCTTEGTRNCAFCGGLFCGIHAREAAVSLNGQPPTKAPLCWICRATVRL